ncbi:CLUMA_CG015574, isoform A [Clunio marinus]|uniref:CLUMA_CG015574, isoform A n=1 Tax=Clunio marinus TaxID=568069 RepID=A0A1J1IR26_9DIPT|nr:CLUMA_CG015574, isoform A [Clunio marinus]
MATDDNICSHKFIKESINDFNDDCHVIIKISLLNIASEISNQILILGLVTLINLNINGAT